MRHRKRIWRIAGALLGIALIAAGIQAVVSNPDDGARCREVNPTASRPNVQRRISTTAGGIELEVFSEVPFPVRAMPSILRIGESDFGLSRHPEDGSLHTLIFQIPAEVFAELTAQDGVFVHHGAFSKTLDTTVEVAGVAGIWTFGRLQTQLLDCLSDDA